MTSTTSAKPRLTSLAPQFLVDDLERTIAYYRDVLGFAFGEPWNGFYAIGQRDGLELHDLRSSLEVCVCDYADLLRRGIAFLPQSKHLIALLPSSTCYRQMTGKNKRC